MKNEGHVHKIQTHVQDDAFKAEFSKALTELLGKIRFRGHWHHEWIAEQIVHGLSEEPMVRRHLIELLSSHDEPEKETA